MRRYLVWLLAAVLLGATACSSGRHSSAGFRLPADGNVERGKADFVAFGCQRCHEVPGAGLPAPTVQPPVPVVLGGLVYGEMTDGYLAASIICPSSQLAPYPEELITAGGKSRMPEYAGQMTVRQLTDLVAFLQSRYVVRRGSPKYPYF
ncbi:MAG TPA: cytochrome c [Bryobacteraceae bacterium]|nr:cytochrome c [Bryobacteraceae bacterium]